MNAKKETYILPYMTAECKTVQNKCLYKCKILAVSVNAVHVYLRPIKRNISLVTIFQTTEDVEINFNS